MATILPFVVRQRAPAMARPAKERERAAIIIFPGIRYEPVDEAGGKAAPAKAGGAPGRRKGKPAQ